MGKIPPKQVKQLITSSLFLGSVIIACAKSTLAQIIPDNSLGSESSVVTSNLINGIISEQINGGARRGRNLFHSFQEFNINVNKSAYFTNPLGIENILTRVTGNNSSEIFGKLGVLGNANLFLMNPKGIIFGQNASLDLDGSFLATTAASINFDNGNQFSATNIQNLSILNVNIPIGLGFGSNPGNIILNNASLQIKPLQTLAIIGGNISLINSNLKAPMGRIELGSIIDSSVGLISLEKGFKLAYINKQNFQDIQLSQQSSLDASGEGGGSIQVQGKNVTLTNNSKIIADTLGNQNGGEILISSDNFKLENSLVSASTFATGNAGNLTIKALQSIELSGTNLLDSQEQVYNGTFDKSQINNGLFTVTFGSGVAGKLNINTNSLTAPNAAPIFTGTFAQGAGGDLSVKATEEINLGHIFWFSGTTSDGISGNITVKAKNLIIQNLGGIETSAVAESNSNAGNININIADSLQIIGAPSNSAFIQTGILSAAGSGDAGNVNITAKQVILESGAYIGSSTANGKGGNLNINALELIKVQGYSPDQFKIPSNIYVDAYGFSVNPNGDTMVTGNGGDLQLSTNHLFIADGGQITAQTLGMGRGGNLLINASKIDLTGASDVTPEAIEQGYYYVGNKFPSALATSSLSSGAAGSLVMNVDNLSIRNGAIITVSSTGSGDAGDLKIQGKSILLERGSINAATISGESGNISIQSQNIQLRNNSQISATAGENSNGGNINFNTQTLISLENSNITANAFKGKGGNININTQAIFVSSDSAITASSQLGINGVVAVKTLGFDLKNNFTPLIGNFVNENQFIAATCLSNNHKKQASFAVIGRQGLLPTPYEPISARYFINQVKPLKEINNKILALSPAKVAEIENGEKSWKLGDPILEAQGLIITPDGHKILGTLSAITSAKNLICNEPK